MASAITKYNTQKMTGDILIPGKLVTQDASAAGVQVGKGKLLRIRVAAATFLAFGKSDIGAVSGTTDPGLELATAGVYLVLATDEYLRCSANPARIEIIS